MSVVVGLGHKNKKKEIYMGKDLVGEYIALKQQYKDIEEKIRAIEMFILEEHRDDPRITIVSARKTLTIKDEVYEKLNKVGIEVDVLEYRKKKLEEFDIDVQNILKNNDDNFSIKLSKESIRVK
jgi:predicted CopG family antitoxin